MTTIFVYVFGEKAVNVEIPWSPGARLNTGFTGIGLEAQLKEWPPRQNNINLGSKLFF